MDPMEVMVVEALEAMEAVEDMDLEEEALEAIQEAATTKEADMEEAVMEDSEVHLILDMERDQLSLEALQALVAIVVLLASEDMGALAEAPLDLVDIPAMVNLEEAAM